MQYLFFDPESAKDQSITCQPFQNILQMKRLQTQAVIQAQAPRDDRVGSWVQIILGNGKHGKGLKKIQRIHQLTILSAKSERSSQVEWMSREFTTYFSLLAGSQSCLGVFYFSSGGNQVDNRQQGMKVIYRRSLKDYLLTYRRMGRGDYFSCMYTRSFVSNHFTAFAIIIYCYCC